MIGAVLHHLLRRWILRVPSENMGDMPLYTVGDIPFLVVFQCDWVKLVRNISAFQKNLSAQEWSSLGIVYPRVGVLAYSFYLFSWAEYCGKTDEIISRPDDCLFAEVFLSYICQIDALIDKRDTRHLWEGNNINEVKLHPKISATASELCKRINALPVDHGRKRLLLAQIIGYRRNALNVMRQFASRNSQPLEAVLNDKQATACNLLSEWGGLLCTLYGIPDTQSQGIYQVFLNFSFLVQIIDDVADSLSDYRDNVHNIFIALVQQNESEWVKLKKLIDQNAQTTSWGWIRKSLPLSYQGIQSLYEIYAAALQAETHKPHVANNMFSVINRYRKLMR